MALTKSQFLKLVQKQIANTSVGASTLRGMAPGTGRATTDCLEQLDLRVFSTNASSFRRALDRETDRLVKRLPKGRWGAARKFLNIFLRGATYNRFVCEAYNLHRAEPWLEVPLDSNVAKKLLGGEGGRAVLPPWRGIKWLDPEMSRQYQDFAAQVAKKEGINRVHLDLLYWRSSQR
ncbi:MAG: hypothetical protein HY723_04790 [Chloroflexi bacterium]|nr:hypothetical protein [Chloroflexota bacterium]